MRFHSILVPTDFSRQAAGAIDMAIDLATRYGSRLKLLHVFAPLGVIVPEGFVPAGADEIERIVEATRERMEPDRARALASGIYVTCDTVQGAAATEIVEVAREGAHDLIVMGTHGRTGLRRLLLGSVAERVVRGAPCPVLVVRPDEHALDHELADVRERDEMSQSILFE